MLIDGRLDDGNDLAAAGGDGRGRGMAPSDMMDGRVAAIRRALDEAGFTQISILSYCVKSA
jgi:delta-aminolevulinic acid dehydratase/porphobilinogen synthase